ncbi:hypothetical protein CORC01_11111 [Colletotrichum orchidophilum]|uniref:Uncharacterized protein n=1 Tax=Colletotrichum orchidophilum TaxID=1209926 RepID=A0A1G4AX36_9PEZI|nr:uncharacterized protein CORC01_11111 [Colletotrichum orchidophilum]OHE93612.1 hypothetical protein CORC01_11111 [Colletotrichum orchidophilum]
MFLTLLTLETYFTVHNRPFTKQTNPSSSSSSSPLPARHPGNETFFIASIHRNSGSLLSSSCTYIGGSEGRVHFSAVESGSRDGTKYQLSTLQRKLEARGVGTIVVLGKSAQEQQDELNARPTATGSRPPGWVWNEGDAQFDMRRVSHLARDARERNLAMDPLETLQKKQDEG